MVLSRFIDLEFANLVGHYILEIERFIKNSDFSFIGLENGVASF